MPATTASKDEIVDRLFAVFQEHGFDGASLSDVSRATGLGKSSLYHHFPDGKLQMAQAVLERATAVIDSEIAEVAKSSLSLKARIRKIVALLNQMYSGGRRLCVLGRIASSSVRADAMDGLRSAFELWISAIASLAEESGMPSRRAATFAEDWVARLQGALIMQAATGDTGAYERTLDALIELGERAAG
ncbi:TetR/AcrR family transcriptional regulator [Burkholderia sp. Ac-20365]|jgi:AcrR family transcriptional regulator|uniref:TetR/AcrR family transcriptional regulator n=1 Tax=Burkholderia sp. Ac-20365 TaxID=2703897 RepID=UPI00197C3B13|nr:TetR/AcrR family transcriptional regulator [Burkholderia sp. Ac-20365]MBN3762191.1 TetR/AcrR family transcriptional regulator [Burkholderia sp. Ac-20365]